MSTIRNIMLTGLVASMPVCAFAFPSPSDASVSAPVGSSSLVATNDLAPCPVGEIFVARGVTVGCDLVGGANTLTEFASVSSSADVAEFASFCFDAGGVVSVSPVDSTILECQDRDF